MNHAIIQTEGLRFAYAEEGAVNPFVLDGVSLDIEEGSFVAVLGHNGSGKSTLAKHLNAILLPSGGKVYVDGIDTADEDKLLDIRRTMKWGKEDATDAEIWEALTTAQAKEVVEGKQDQLDFMLEQNGKNLSGGQKQRVAIAGVIAMAPRCIVLDEPTAMLDPIGRAEVMKTIRELNRSSGVTVVLITHHMDEAAQADRLVVMAKGRVVADGTPRKVFQRVEELKAVGLTVPETTELLWQLRQAGVDVPLDALSDEECAQALFDLLQTRA